jgi:hypothetical protein
MVYVNWLTVYVGDTFVALEVNSREYFASKSFAAALLFPYASLDVTVIVVEPPALIETALRAE